MDLPCPLHPQTAPDPHAGEGAAQAAAAYLAVKPAPTRAQQTPGAAAGLAFPWGLITIPADGLIIGRDYGRSCGNQIDTYDNISRRHARISVESGEVFVEDLDSTNGTTVNGAPITPRRRTRVTAGDVVGFGNRLKVSVTAQEQP